MWGRKEINIHNISGTFEVQAPYRFSSEDRFDLFSHLVLEVKTSSSDLDRMNANFGENIDNRFVPEFMVKLPYRAYELKKFKDGHDVSVRYILSTADSDNIQYILSSVSSEYCNKWIDGRRGHLIDLMAYLCVEVVREDEFNRQAVAALAELIKIEIFDLAEEYAIKKSAGGIQKWEKARILSAVSSIEARVKVTEVADTCGLSRRQLHRKFVAHTGASLAEHQAAARLDVATCQLIQSDEPIKSIALSLGFSNSSNFSRFFKSKVGTSPGGFRKRRNGYNT